jgi:hypothetical protein
MAISVTYPGLSVVLRSSCFACFVLLRNLTEGQRRSIIRSKMFLKEKFLPDGTFDKPSSWWRYAGP